MSKCQRRAKRRSGSPRYESSSSTPTGVANRGISRLASPTHSAAAIRLPAYESHCPVEIDGIHSRDLPVIGVGTLQALIMGIRLLGTLLHDFVSRGGRILDPDDDSEVP